MAAPSPLSAVLDVADILRNGAESVKLKLGDHEVVLDRRSLKKLSTAQGGDR